VAAIALQVFPTLLGKVQADAFGYELAEPFQ
jgi:hypothetical protein